MKKASTVQVPVEQKNSAVARSNGDREKRVAVAAVPVPVTSVRELETLALLHDLQVHQIELEMQNEELRQAQVKITALGARYRELYDFAPVGYLTLDGKGRIAEANLAGAALLGVVRRDLIKRRFSLFLSLESQAEYRQFLQKLINTGDKQTREFSLPLSNDKVRYLQADAIVSEDETEDGHQIHLSILDITERRRFEDQTAERQTSALIQTLNALTTVPEMDVFLEHVLTALLQCLKANSASLWLYNREQDSLSLYLECEDGHAVKGKDAKHPAASTPQSTQSNPFYNLLISSRQPVLVDLVSGKFDVPYRGWLLRRGYKCILFVPLLLGNETLGWFSIRNIVPTTYRSSEMELAQALAQQATLALQMTRVAKQGQKSAVLVERNRLAQDIHDTLAQAFTGILVQLQASVYAPDADQKQAHVAQARELARVGLQEARRSVRALRPQALEGENLAGALAHLVAHATKPASMVVEFTMQGRPYALPNEIEDHLFRIGQEALSNAIRHSHATLVQMELTFLVDEVRVCIQDNGKGFEIRPGSPANGFGLIGMHERCVEIHGTLTVTPGTANGTAVTVTVPVERIKADAIL